MDDGQRVCTLALSRAALSESIVYTYRLIRLMYVLLRIEPLAPMVDALSAQGRALERRYAPGGAGYVYARDDFEARADKLPRLM